MHLRRASRAWAAIVVVLAARDGAAQQPGEASAAPSRALHAVGFRTAWELDRGRTYATGFDGGATYGEERAPRPILVNVWYPAEADTGAPMHHGSYFDIGPAHVELGTGAADGETGAGADAELARFARALSDFARAVFVEEVTGEAKAALDERERGALATLLAQPIASRADATPAAGRYPLVVYHSGAGSSFEDNAFLCESLASHGFVVVGSAYPKADGSTLAIDGGAASAEDMLFLVRHAAALPFVDARRFALVGHSAGAQAALKCAARADAVAAAVVLLDTTQDYYALSMPLHESLVQETSAKVAALAEPLLVAANPEAQFALCDTFVRSERVYLTVPHVGHDEFIAQGIQRLRFLELVGDTAERERAESVRASYAALCEYVRLFLDARLRGDEREWGERTAACRASALGSALHVELAPLGTSEPAPFDAEGSVAPTPRQWRRLVDRLDGAGICALLERHRASEPTSPIYSSTMLTGSLLFELVRAERGEDARTLLAYLRGIELDPLSLFHFLAEINSLQGKRAQALEILRVARELDPDDAELRAKELALEETEGE